MRALRRVITYLWNESDMAYPFLYDYIEGMGWRTQEEVRKQMKVNFDTIPGAFLAMMIAGPSQLFMFWERWTFTLPVPPLQNIRYAVRSLTRLLFNLILIIYNYYKGDKFIISTKNNSLENMYIQTGILNGKPFTTQILDHSIITAGGELILTMNSTPSK